jgi:6-phosphofructokinase 1
MCEVLKAGRAAGRRDSIVIVAEGAQDRNGQPIESAYVKQVLAERLGEDVRVTILGHVQRGGAPSAFDRNLSTLLGAAAVAEVFTAAPGSTPCLIGIHGNRVTRSPLCVDQTRRIAKAMEERDFATALVSVAITSKRHSALFVRWCAPCRIRRRQISAACV